MQNDNTMSRSPVIAAAAGSAALAQPSGGRAKGPLVWLDMDQQALDDAYDQQVYAPNRDQVGKRRIANSDKVRAIIGAPERVAYGPTEIEKADIYRTRARQRAGQRLHPWRRLARQPRRRLRVPGGAVRQCGRALRRPRLHQRRRSGRQPVSDGRTGAARGGLGLSQRQDVRRRSRADLSVVAFVRLAPLRLRADARLAQGGSAGRHRQGRGARQRHVRPQAGAALEALEIRQLHRRDGAGAERAAPHRQAQRARSCSPTAPTRRRNSSASRAISSPP